MGIGRTGRVVAALIGGLVLVGLWLQGLDVWRTRFEDPTLAGVVWYLVRYFTILTNAMIVGTMALVAA